MKTRMLLSYYCEMITWDVYNRTAGAVGVVVAILVATATVLTDDKSERELAVGTALAYENKAQQDGKSNSS